ncbi:NHL repeat-containing protein [Baekduia sp.]|uniref:NHL repeat-containing protein n=1 Tax=Baekduia sp. TaxID=2600305 RepID=UPI002E031AFE|nr:NHL repeat-containing protein [Baekduia sp.]
MSLLALLTALVVAGPAVADISRQPAGSFGSFSGHSPQALTVDQHNGDVYALDPANGKLHRFTATGAPDNFTAGPGAGTNTIAGLPLASTDLRLAQVAIDRSGGPADGDIYVADGSGSAVRVFGNDGAPLTTLNGSGTPVSGYGFACGVAVDQANGDVYVGDYVGQAVWRYTPSSSTPSESDYSGGIATATTPCGVVAAAGKVYAGDTYDQIDIERFDASDFTTGPPPTPTPAIVDANHPTALAVDPVTGDLYADGVLNDYAGTQRVTVYDSSGTLLYRFAPDIEGSAGVAVKAGGQAYVSDPTNNRIDAFTPPGLSPGFGFASFDGAADTQAGSPVTQAGSHPFQATTSFSLNPAFAPTGYRYPDGDLKDLRVDLPPGFVGDPDATPHCTQVDFNGDFSLGIGGCPDDTVIGYVHLVLAAGSNGSDEIDPIWNLDPPPGRPAQFGFISSVAPVRLDAALRTGGDYGLTVKADNVNQTYALLRSEATFFGVPADPAHDQFRGICVKTPDADSCPSDQPLKPFLTLPTSCTGPVTTTIRADSWENPGVFASRSFLSHDNVGSPIGGTGCDRLDFTPSITVQPDVTVADSATGLHVDLRIPQAGLQDTDGLAAADLKKAVVTLPEGVSVNPSSADGLDACTPTQVDIHGPGAAHCPDAAKVGSVEIDTPLLDHPVKGAVYLAAQNDNPTDSVLGIYIAVDDPQSGIVVKLAGKVHADPATGQLTTTFDDNPQLPFSDFKLDFFGGPRAALATADGCGTFSTVTALSPWSGTPAKTPGDSFAVNANCAGGFAPSFTAGTTNPSAGHATGFTLKVTRADGQQHVKSVTTTLAPGLLANVGSVPLCSDSDAASGTCSDASQVGTTDVAAGPGSNPFHVAGKVFLTGPYKGGPYGLSIVTRAIAGPFDLGTVVVRAAINVDPIDAHVTAVSDDVPNILDVKGDDGETDGFPLRVRSISVNMDRPGFMLNPTSCDPMAISGTLGSWEGGSAAVGSRFQVGNCSSLAVAPKLALSLTGKGQTTDDKHPGVHAVLTQTPGLANLKKVEVTLPLSLALDPDNAQALCEFADGSKVEPTCPKASIVGHVTAESPILDGPLTGPVYFVKNIRVDAKTGRQIRTLPKLVIPLTGPNGLRLNLTGLSSVPDNKHLVSTFDLIPDAPVSKFTLDIDGGKHGILVVSGANICKSTQKATQEATGQNGKVTDATVTIGTPCTLGVTASSHTSTALKLTVGGLGAGKVAVSGNAITKTSRTIASATSATLTAKLTRAARAALAHHRNVTVRLTISFTPKGAKKAKIMHKTLTIHGASKSDKK